MTRIDAHHHLWRTTRADYGWLTPQAGILYRDFEPDELEPLLAAAGIDATILIQAAPSTAETDFLLELAERNDWIAGVVGWADLSAPDAEAHIAERARHRLLVGLRPMLQDMEERRWILRPEIQPALAAMARHELVLDALVREDQIDMIAIVAELHPGLTIILDHGGKPAIGKGDRTKWQTAIRRLAMHSNSCVKLSGLLTEAPIGAGTDILQPYVDMMIDAFGTERVIWGSDWPVATLSGDYADWVALTNELLASLDEPRRDAILGGNAARHYRLKDKRG